MPRSRRRRANDRRRDADQRRVASEVLQRPLSEKENLDRYVRSVYRNRAGETVVGRDGKTYRVQEDGSLRPV